MVPRNLNLLVIVGQTASGKTDLAINLAKKFNGEVVCADSRTVYKGMNIGTAKPTEEERTEIPHHLIDVVNPDEKFTVADFKNLADEAITDIQSRGKLPIMVGGSGLYVDSVLYNYQFRESPSISIREKYNTKTVPELQNLILEQGLELPNNPGNPRHLVRVLESKGATSTKNDIAESTYIIGLKIDKDELKSRIIKRVDAMVELGLIDEVKKLADRYGWEVEAMQGTGYKALKDYVLGIISLEEAKSLFVRNDMQLAKRQMIWFKRNKSIHWVDKQTRAVELVTTQLNK